MSGRRRDKPRLYKRGNIWYGWVWESGQWDYRSTKCRDYKAAAEVQAQWERDAADPAGAAARRTTMNDILSSYLDACAELVPQQKLSQATLISYQKKARQIIRIFEHGGDAKAPRTPFYVAALEASHVDGYVSQRRAEGTKDHTIHKERSVLRGALRRALHHKRWAGSLAAVMPEKFSTGYEPKKRALYWEELWKLIEVMPKKRAAHIAFIVATSADWGESCIAERDDINDACTEVLLKGTKTKYRKRTVPIVTSEQAKLLRFALDNAPNKKGVLFEKWGNVRRGLQVACERAKIEPCTPKDLRRTYATRLHAMGAPLSLIAPTMGHKDTRMLERVYGRLPISDLAESLKRALQKAKEGGHTTNALQSRRVRTLKASLRKGRSAFARGLKIPVSAVQLRPWAQQNPAPEPSDSGVLLFVAPSSDSPNNPQNPPTSKESTTNALQLLKSAYIGEALSYGFLEAAEMRGEWLDGRLQ